VLADVVGDGGEILRVGRQTAHDFESPFKELGHGSYRFIDAT
jgi:hypothetical protein